MAWVISITAMPNRSFMSCKQIEDLRLNGDVERGGRLVGDHKLGPAGQRHGDHHALAHAAGELVRVVIDAACGIGDLNQLQHLDGAGERLLAGRKFSWRRRLSAICSPMV